MQAARGASLTPSGTTRSRARLQALWGAVALAAYALDLASKQWALRSLADGDVPVVGDLLVLHLTFNPGAAFGAGTGVTPVFAVFAIAACGIVCWLARRLGSTLWAVGLGLLLAGAAGNLTDRILREPGPFHGHVVDFLRLPHWPVFNVADVCINIAVGIVIVQLMRGVRVDGTLEADR